MFDRLRRWLGLTDPTIPCAPPLPAAGATPVYATPLGGPENGTGSGRFVCRDLVLDRAEHIAGYEFSLGRRPQTHPQENCALLRAYDEAMLRNLAPLGRSSFMDDRLCFIRVSVASLGSPLLDVFAHFNTLIMISPAAIAECDPATVRADLDRLRGIGIALGWTIDRPRPEIDSLIGAGRLIEVETAGIDGIDLKSMHRRLRKLDGKIRLMASQLQTADDFDFSFQCGFDYFMGPFVGNREHWHPAKSEINRLRVFEVLNMIRAEADYDAIADRLRTDPTLTFKLLRYVNSPAFGLGQKVEGIAQMLVVLGRDRFYRWLSLLLFDLSEPGYRARVLAEQALTRARFMELLAGRGRIPAKAEHLFLSGLFSLIDAMMGHPLDEVLQQVKLPEEVAGALRGNPGAMTDALHLGVAVESSAPERIATAAAQCGLGPAEITRLMVDALSRSQQSMAAGEPLALGTGLMIEALAGAQPVVGTQP